jgi:tripartite-type tricarboxylate transporter receptor subunit TctC
MLRLSSNLGFDWQRNALEISERNAGPKAMRLPLLLGAAFLVCTTVLSAADESYPSKSVRLIVPAAPGGPIDIVARILADGLKTAWPVSIVVENRTGAGTSTGAAYVASAAPDGYTLLVSPDSIAVNPSLYPNISPDPLKSFEPVAMLVTATQVLVVRSDLGVSDLQAFLALAKGRQAGLNMASAGAGTISHLTEVLLELRTGTHTTHIPFKGAAPALTAMLGGHVDAMWVMLAPAQSYITAGKIKAIAVTSAGRDPKLPNVPTVEEGGIADFQVMNWQGLFAPAGTPKPIVERIWQGVRDVLAKPEIKSRMASAGFDARGDGPEVVAEQIRLSVPKWADVVKRAGIRPAD